MSTEAHCMNSNVHKFYHLNIKKKVICLLDSNLSTIKYKNYIKKVLPETITLHLLYYILLDTGIIFLFIYIAITLAYR